MLARDALGVDTLLTIGVNFAVSLAGDGAVTVTTLFLPAAPKTLII